MFQLNDEGENMYTYEFKGKLVSGISLAMFITFMILVTGTVYKIGLGVVALLLLKDFISVLTSTYQVDEK